MPEGVEKAPDSSQQTGGNEKAQKLAAELKAIAAEQNGPEDPSTNLNQDIADNIGRAQAEAQRRVESKEAVEQAQLAFISDISERDIPVVLFGGYAEDALLAGDITREHHDVDVLLDREKLEETLAKLGDTGYSVEVITESGSDSPYKLLAAKDGAVFDIALLDKNDQGEPYIDVEGAGDGGAREIQRIFLPPGSLDGATASMRGQEVKVVPPLALMYVRTAMERTGRFPSGPRQKDIDGEKAIRERFFPGSNKDDSVFQGRIEKISKPAA